MRSVLLALALGGALSACAPSPSRDPALFDQLGGMTGVERIVSGMIDRSLADPRIAWSFDNTNHDRLKRLIAQQFCHLSGGPCPRRPRLRSSAGRSRFCRSRT